MPANQSVCNHTSDQRESDLLITSIITDRINKIGLLSISLDITIILDTASCVLGLALGVCMDPCPGACLFHLCLHLSPQPVEIKP